MVSCSSLVINTGRADKGWSACPSTSSRVDFEDVVEARDAEDLADVRVEVDQSEGVARVHEPLLGGEEEPETGARDVGQLGKI